MELKLFELKKLWGEPIDFESYELNFPIGPVCTDSRNIEKGNFFVPLVGANFDGHDFLYEAFKRGAHAAIVSSENKFKVPQGLLHWIVEDTLKAYQQLALLHRLHLKLPVVAITGSAGKTTTRELIRSVLTPLGSVLASSDNNNNEIGVPLTLLKANSTHSVIVVEMGMRGLGEIKCLSCCTKPDIAVITNIGSAHLGRLGSRALIAKAKCEITACLKPSGFVVIPAGDQLLEEALKVNWKGRVIRVKLQDELSNNLFENSNMHKLPNADLLGHLNLTKNLLTFEGETFELPLDGRHNALNLMLAFAVAKELRVPFDLLKKVSVQLPSGHHRCLKYGRLTVYDETYNSSPEAVQAALESLVRRPGRHFAVIGKMLELGDFSIDLHRKIAEDIVNLGLDGLVVVADGPEAIVMEKAAKSLSRLAIVTTPEQAIEPLKSWLEPGDSLLLKASRGIELERLLPLLPRDI